MRKVTASWQQGFAGIDPALLGGNRRAASGSQVHATGGADEILMLGVATTPTLDASLRYYQLP